MRFTTKTGSEYELNRAAMTWTRIKRSDASGSIRAEGGMLLAWPNLEIGRSAFLLDSEILPAHEAHYVITSPVTEIFADDSENR